MMGGADGDALDCLLSEYFDCDHEANFLEVGMNNTTDESNLLSLKAVMRVMKGSTVTDTESAYIFDMQDWETWLDSDTNDSD